LPFKITIFTSILMRAEAYTGKGEISKINVKPPCSWFLLSVCHGYSDRTVRKDLKDDEKLVYLYKIHVSYIYM